MASYRFSSDPKGDRMGMSRSSYPFSMDWAAAKDVMVVISIHIDMEGDGSPAVLRLALFYF